MQVPSTSIPLMPHQEEGARFALERQRVLIADEMGVGKTPTGIAIALASIESGMRPVLVVVPPSMRLQWVREFARFAPEVTTATLKGTNPYRDGEPTLPDVDVLIIGDTSLSGWKMVLLGKVAGMIVDECHRMKDAKRAKRTRACIEIAQSIPANGLRVAMSGTPLINKPMELLSIINILNRGDAFAGGIAGFLNKYAPRVDGYGSRGASNLEELHNVLTRTFMIRRKREEVLTLPDKGRIQVPVELDDDNLKKYTLAERDLFRWILMTKGTERAKSSMRAKGLVKLNELRRLSALGKVDAIEKYVLDLLEQEEQVFLTCAFIDEAKAYYERFREDFNAVRVVGGMTDVEKMAAVDAFQSGESRVLVGNIVAAGTGLTLVKGRHHVSCSLPYTSADLLQCEDRLSRHGQTREVVSHIMLATLPKGDSIDMRMIALLEHKNDILSTVLDGRETDLIDHDSEAIAMQVLRSYGW